MAISLSARGTSGSRSERLQAVWIGIRLRNVSSLLPEIACQFQIEDVDIVNPADSAAVAEFKKVPRVVPRSTDAQLRVQEPPGVPNA